jgi:hypothetical protein
MLFLITCILLVWHGCDPLEDSPFSVSEYPTRYHALSATQLESLRKEYITLNENKICTSLNDLGFPEYSLTPCLSRPILRVPISENVESAVANAKLTLGKNSKFTNVTDTAEVMLRRFDRLDGCIKCDGSSGDIQQISWRFDFANQRYQGLEILESAIVVFLDAEGVIMLGGNFFRQIHIPPTDRFSFEQAKKSLIGRELKFNTWGGPQTYIIADSSFVSSPAPEKFIVQVKASQGLEMHVAWRMPVGWGGSPLWFIYVDSTTGEVVREEILFMSVTQNSEDA